MCKFNKLTNMEDGLGLNTSSLYVCVLEKILKLTLSLILRAVLCVVTPAISTWMDDRLSQGQQNVIMIYIWTNLSIIDWLLPKMMA